MLDSRSPRRSRTRPLGAVRIAETKFPPINSRKIDGVLGSAMNLPPARPIVEARDVPVPAPPPPPSATSIKEQDIKPKRKTPTENDEQRKKEREESATRELSLKQEILHLQKSLDENRRQVWDKEKTIEELKQQFERQEEHYRELYETECRHHKETKAELKNSEDMRHKEQETFRKDMEKMNLELDNIREKMLADLESLKTLKDHQIADRDDRLEKLKRQMATTLAGNSWERQQQLDELSKELTKANEEIEMLKMKMRKNNNKDCSNCNVLRSQLQSVNKQLAQQLRQ